MRIPTPSCRAQPRGARTAGRRGTHIVSNKVSGAELEVLLCNIELEAPIAGAAHSPGGRAVPTQRVWIMRVTHALPTHTRNARPSTWLLVIDCVRTNVLVCAIREQGEGQSDVRRAAERLSTLTRTLRGVQAPASGRHETHRQSCTYGPAPPPSPPFRHRRHGGVVCVALQRVPRPVDGGEDHRAVARRVLRRGPLRLPPVHGEQCGAVRFSLARPCAPRCAAARGGAISAGACTFLSGAHFRLPSSSPPLHGPPRRPTAPACCPR